MEKARKNKLITVEKTPFVLYCAACACPSVFETNRGTFIIVGKELNLKEINQELKNKIGAEKFRRYLHSFFNNNKFMRELEYFSKIKSNIETSLEYTGFDYLSSTDFHYNEKFEKIITDIEKKLARFIGLVLKELSKGMEIEL